MMPEEELSPEVYRLLGSGRKIEAIKLIREETGLGLREAKELAEAISAQYEYGTAPPPEMKEVGGARSGIVLVIAVLIAYLVYVFFLSD